MRIALGQINPTVGDLAGNVALCTRFARDAAARGAELVVFPELSLTGYPPRDLVCDFVSTVTLVLPPHGPAGTTQVHEDDVGRACSRLQAALRAGGPPPSSAGCPMALSGHPGG